MTAIKQGIRAVTSVGKYAGLLCLDPQLKDEYVAEGATFVGVGVDTLILSQGAKKLAATASLNLDASDTVNQPEPIQAGY